MAALSTTLATIAFAGAFLSWLAAAVFAFGIWRHRGQVSGLELAGSFMTALGKLPPEAQPFLKRFFAAFIAFFAFVLVGVLAGITASR